MGTQSFRGAGGAGAVRTSRAQLEALDERNDTPLEAPRAFSQLEGDRRRNSRGRGWVLSLDVERRLREVRARVGDTLPRARPLDEADDVALIRACRAGF
jgi:hypothetical protein